MIELFGVGLSLMEIIAIGTILFGLIGGYVRLDMRLKNILERNDKADRAQQVLEKKVESVETILRKEINETKGATESRFAIQEERMRAQDIFSGRMEEKFTFVEKQIGRILDILERGKQ
jgi:hypothetical protein